MPRLIVNADDFGYTSGINRAIVELNGRGALTSATLMARGAAFNDALSSVLVPGGQGAQPVGVGCHVVLVDGHPVAASSSIPSLLAPSRVTGKGSAAPAFRATLAAFVSDLERGRIREAEIETETIAQIQWLQVRGIAVTHLDTHKHTHMFPRVLRPVLRAALRCGVKAIRNPFEPEWSRAATPRASLVRRVEVGLLQLLRPGFQRLVAESGLATTAGALGVLATGTLDAAALEQILRAALRTAGTTSTEATWELVCHPGYHDADLAAQRTRLQSSREQERTALAEVLPMLQDFDLVNFGELTQKRATSKRAV